MLLLLLLLLLLSGRISRRRSLRLSVLVVRVVLPVGLLLVGVLVLLWREDVLHDIVTLCARGGACSRRLSPREVGVEGVEVVDWP